MREITAGIRSTSAVETDQPKPIAGSKLAVAGSAQRIEQILDAARELIREAA